jgi:hypothetical protein
LFVSAALLPPGTLAPDFIHLIKCPKNEGAEDHTAAADCGIVSLFFFLAGGNCRLLGTEGASSTRFQRWSHNKQQKHRQRHSEHSTHRHRSLWRPPADGHLSPLEV